MNGRIYDYNLGRFLSVDPFIQAPGNSQSMNPYSYIMNNPLAGTDPSGYIADVSSNACGGLTDCFRNQNFNNLSMMSNIATDNGFNKGQGEPRKKPIEPEKIRPKCKSGATACTVFTAKTLKHAKALNNAEIMNALKAQLLRKAAEAAVRVRQSMRVSPHGFLLAAAILPSQMATDADCSSGCSGPMFAGEGDGEGTSDDGDTGGTRDSDDGNLNTSGGGKNAKHSNADKRNAARKKWNDAKKKLEDAKRNGAPKTEKRQIQKEIDHWKRKMDFSGENHSMKPKK